MPLFIYSLGVPFLLTVVLGQALYLWAPSLLPAFKSLLPACIAGALLALLAMAYLWFQSSNL